MLSFCTRTKITDEEATSSPMGSIILSNFSSMDRMSRDMLEIRTPIGDHHLFLGNKNDVCFGTSWNIELHMVERLNMIWSHIEEFHVYGRVSEMFNLGWGEMKF